MNDQKKFNFARDVIDQWAHNTPDSLALLWIGQNGYERHISFKDISDASCQAANILKKAGIKRGDTVIILLGRPVAWWEILTACLRMGVVASPGTTQLAEKDIQYRMNATGATCVITDGSCAAKVDAVKAQCHSLAVCVLVGGERDGWINYDYELPRQKTVSKPVETLADEDSLCYFTSGTTGNPKMCMHNHEYGRGHITTGEYWLDLKESDLHWNLSDTGWAKAAWSSYFGPWLLGASLFVHDASGFDPKASL